MRVKAVVVPLVAALTLLAGCGGGPTPAPRTVAAEPTATAAASSSPSGPVVVPETLKFNGTTLDGKPFDATALAGRPVVLWFWAPWCSTCLGQAAAVSELATQYDGKVSLIGIAGLDQSSKAMNEFVAQGEVGNVTHLNDKAGVLWKRFGIKEQSVFVMINRSGKVMQNGYQDTVTLGDWVAYLDKH
jgi:thiol-disulfide isomerase/thioredoxin